MQTQNSSNLQNIARYLIYKHYLTSLFSVLLEQNLPFIILKGWSFIPDLYPDPATRPFSDVDILIHPQDYPAITAMMASLGYVQSGSEPATTIAHPTPTYIPLEITFSHPAGVHIDLHIHLLTLAWWQPAFPIDLEHVWHTAQHYQDSTSLQLLRLSPEVTFLHLCIHLWNHEPFNSRFHTYTDLVLLLKKYSHLMNWDLIKQLARNWHMQNLVYWITYVLQHHFDTTIPIEIQPKSHPKSLQYRLGRAGLDPAPRLVPAPGLVPDPGLSLPHRSASAPRLTPPLWRSAFLLRLVLIDDLNLLPKLLFSALFPNPTLRTAIHNRSCSLLQHWQTYTHRLLRQ